MAIYYKVKPEKHGCWIMCHWTDGTRTERTLHKNELLTVGEMERFGIDPDYVVRVEYSQKKVVFKRDYECGRPESKPRRYLPEDVAGYHLIEHPYRKEKKQPETLARMLGRIFLPPRR